MTFHPRMALILAGLAIGLPSAAEDSSQSMFKFRGFLTLGATHSNLKDADFPSTAIQPSGAGYSRSVDFGGETHLGLQADAQFTPWLSGVLQVVTERVWNDRFQPRIMMASLKAQPLPWLSIKAGRMPISSYLISDYKKVGYSITWVRPPAEIYQANPIDYVDGGEIGVQHNLGSVAMNWQLQLGSGRTKLADKPRFEFIAKDMYSLSLAAVYGSSSFRTYYIRFRGTIDSEALSGPTGWFSLMRTPGFPYYNPQLADKYDYRGRRGSYLTMGYTYDPGTWFVSAEVARIRGEESILAFNTGSYLTGGMRLGEWTPYLVVARNHTDSDLLSSHPIIQAILNTRRQAQTSYSAGVRWDFRQNMDLKLQFDHVKNDAGSRGVVVNMQPGFQLGASYNLITACFDMVF
ncbi:MAG: hypothetical protein LWX11_00650 [Firmicutes bacterium]|nr:hypothetical protein [Bacillota bacterium]